MPWRRRDLNAVLHAIAQLNEILTPAPLDATPVSDYLRQDFSAWRALASPSVLPPASLLLDEWSRRNLDRLARLESAWDEVAAGHTLLHTDLRADNVLITERGEVLFVDWPHACIGAAFVDTVL